MALTTVRSSEAAVQGAVAQALRGRRLDVKGFLFEVSLVVCLLLSLIVLSVLIVTVLFDGIGVYNDGLAGTYSLGPVDFTLSEAGERVADRGWGFLDDGISSRAGSAGISQAIIGSFWIAVSVVVFAFPLGIGAALYLEEYAPRNRLTSFIELNIRNLAGVPSVVYGLLGLAIFVQALSGFGAHEGVARRTLIAAGLTLAVLALPIVIITTSEAIRAVPQSLREGAYGAGATRWEVIRTVVLPYAAPGILTGSLLSISRAVGEAAPLIVLGTVTGFSGSGVGLNLENISDTSALGKRFVALPTVISEWVKEPSKEFNIHLAAATILAMLVFVLLINSLAIVLRNRFERKRLG